MSETSKFYLERAEQSARDAASTNLSNVRDRCLRSEAAWRLMAERLERTETTRRQAMADRAERAAATEVPA